MSTGPSYRFIAKVLASSEKDMTGPLAVPESINWNEVVYIGSNNYVLQTLHVKFRRTEFAGILPALLKAHLKEVYTLNLARNKRILGQVHDINEILKSGNITPIFMKGTGNLIDGLYEDPGERIMLDIDVLTGPENMEKAALLLKAEGYSSHENYGEAGKAAMKHFPPVYKEGEPAQVEIHRLPVNIQYSPLFDYASADREKRPALNDPGIMVMSDAHKIRLSFIHSQLIHWGHQNALPSLRELYDLYLLSQREDPAAIFSEAGPFRGKAAGYLRVMRSTFGVENNLPQGLRGRGRLYLFRHNTALKHPRTGRIMYRLLRAWRLYFEIPIKSLFNINYRIYIKARLKDPSWYKRNLGIDKFTGNKK